jgi:hypothetical protein
MDMQQDLSSFNYPCEVCIDTLGSRLSASLARMAGPVNKIVWKTMAFVEKTLLNHKAHIFGGYVRDKIVHDHHATVFYEEVLADPHAKLIAKDVQDKYNDATFLPKYAHRLLLPHDIDCFMYSDDMKTFIKAIQAACYTTHVKRSRQAKFYFSRLSNNVDPNLEKITHTKLLIRPRIPKVLEDSIDVNVFTVYLDILHTNDRDLDFFKTLTKNVDFECNGLIITPQNDYKLASSIGKFLNPMEKLEKIKEIFDNITNNIAKPVGYESDISLYRYMKMISKGWTLKLHPITIFRSTQTCDGHCLICHGDLQGCLIKDSQCAALYHPLCFQKMIESSSFERQCPMCKAPCAIPPEIHELIDNISETIRIEADTSVMN